MEFMGSFFKKNSQEKEIDTIQKKNYAEFNTENGLI